MTSLFAYILGFNYLENSELAIFDLSLFSIIKFGLIFCIQGGSHIQLVLGVWKFQVSFGIGNLALSESNEEKQIKSNNEN